ncbi:MAG TPA: selenocysteine-specific translation elongation factor, partial [Thermodesulfobacteriota bacterium]|nr:selenocysteine-specific translation elongation factor [Thermodesulfobacteriota bacterium]
DHGKTSLIKALTGMDTDRLKEEKARGISIDLGFAYLDLPDGTKAGIVDVPGHERFIRNMLAGATGIDLVLFVVAADDGIMPQTREHLDIMHLLGIKSGIFVITKIDLVDVGQINKVSEDIKALIKDTCLKDSPIISVSSATGSGIDNLKNLIIDEAKKNLQRPEGGFFRLPIDRTFSIKGFGAVVTGTVLSGNINKNADAVIISKRATAPKKVKIRGVQSHFKEVSAITAGQRAAINLSGISHTDIERGNMLVSPDMDMITDMAEVSFEFLNSTKKPIKNYSILKLYHMTDETMANVSFAGVNEAGPGAKVFGRVRLKEPMAMMRGDRFILRDHAINATIGGGRVLLPYPENVAVTFRLRDKPRLKPAATQDRQRQYQVLDSQDLGKILISILSDKDTFGIDSHAIRLMLNISEKIYEEIITSQMDKIVQIGEQLILKEKIVKIEHLIVNAIQSHHLDMPGDIGIDENNLVRSVLGAIDSNIIQAILKNLVSAGKIVKRANVLSLSSHKPQAKGIEKEIEDAILAVFSKEGFNPVKLDDVLQIPLYKKDDVKNVFQLLIKRGIVVKITEDSYISKINLDEAKDRLARWVGDKGKIKAAEFRDVLGCGRKFAIELLEYFDKERITLRSGDYRVLRKTLSAKQ